MVWPILFLDLTDGKGTYPPPKCHAGASPPAPVNPRPALCLKAKSRTRAVLVLASHDLNAAKDRPRNSSLGAPCLYFFFLALLLQKHGAIGLYAPGLVGVESVSDPL